MPEPRDPRALLDSAEQAAVAGDNVSAARLMSEAALLQEAALGPLSPDLANTLNNLGVLHEILGEHAAAEECYRRAYGIARGVLGLEHPFVETSEKNLRDFCEARGRSMDAPGEPSGRSRSPAPHVPRVAPAPQPSRPATRSFRPLVIGAICAGALLLVAILAARVWFGPTARAGYTPEEAPRPPAASPAPTPAPASAIPKPDEAAARASAPAVVRENPPTTASGLAALSVAEARVCRNFSTASARDWRCDPVSSPVDAGTFYFYSKLRSASDTAVEHRWYHGDRLHQAVELPVRANPGTGYRTYSRNTVSRANAGDWRVELRAKDGTLLHEERFTVR